IAVNRKQADTGRLGFWFTPRASVVVPKRSEEKSITKRGVVAMNSTAASRSAIAAAIGRGFKSRRPDVSMDCRRDMFCAVRGRNHARISPVNTSSIGWLFIVRVNLIQTDSAVTGTFFQRDGFT